MRNLRRKRRVRPSTAPFGRLQLVTRASASPPQVPTTSSAVRTNPSCRTIAGPVFRGASLIFTVATNRRQPVLTEESLRMALQAGIDRARRTLPFRIDAWVLLPDHLHCIWTLLPGDSNFAARWAIIKRQASRCCAEARKSSLSPSQRKRKESGFWQKRFWEHLIRDVIDLERHVEYIHWNPVKHGYVWSVTDWPYSTFHRYVREGIYPDDWGAAYVDADGAGFGE